MEQWTTVIKPQSRLWEVDFKELWRYRDLFVMYVKRDIITQYKQTILGPLWFLIQPALTTIMYMVVFGGIAGIPTDGVPQPLFYLAGICIWQYFADCLNKTSQTFISFIFWGVKNQVYYYIFHLNMLLLMVNIGLRLVMLLMLLVRCHILIILVEMLILGLILIGQYTIGQLVLRKDRLKFQLQR